ncbi:hypothetical protein C8K15_10390 [Paenisporosarcina sp. OV554]|nr:hypothetical protein C8K15_10390 [Paenisporosarcina sp. OV554]
MKTVLVLAAILGAYGQGRDIIKQQKSHNPELSSVIVAFKVLLHC